MTPERIAFVLTALAAIVVVLTRVRMSSREDQAAGRLAIPATLVNVHTIFGVLALATWLYYLLANGDWAFGLAGLVCWWITALAGLLILARWLPAQGRHASGPAKDSWSEGPGLSVLGHVGLVVGSIVWTVLFALDKLS